MSVRVARARRSRRPCEKSRAGGVGDSRLHRGRSATRRKETTAAASSTGGDSLSASMADIATFLPCITSSRPAISAAASPRSAIASWSDRRLDTHTRAHTRTPSSHAHDPSDWLSDRLRAVSSLDLLGPLTHSLTPPGVTGAKPPSDPSSSLDSMRVSIIGGVRNNESVVPQREASAVGDGREEFAVETVIAALRSHRPLRPYHSLSPTQQRWRRALLLITAHRLNMPVDVVCEVASSPKDLLHLACRDRSRARSIKGVRIASEHRVVATRIELADTHCHINIRR
jgi:hypothetical protein